jgi:protein-tyrosine phosphatase
MSTEDKTLPEVSASDFDDESLARVLQAEEDDAYAKQLQQQQEAQQQSRSQIFGGNNNVSNARSWEQWFTEQSVEAVKVASQAADATMSAAKIAKDQAKVLAKQAKESAENFSKTYDIDLKKVPNIFNLSGDSDNALKSTNGKAKKINDELDFIYITENVVAMAYPIDPLQPQQTTASNGNDINKVSAYLKQHHNGKYMVWNISEEGYDATPFNNQMLEYKFPGHPAPPLGILFKICTSIESWLDADEDHIAIIHCLTGKGRTSALAACVLAWNGEFSTPLEALEYVAQRRNVAVDTLTIPSQRRYVTYFSNIMDGVKPSSEPLFLRRIIMNTIPVFGDNGGGEANEGCCPYVQLFKGGKLIATAVAVGEERGMEATNKKESMTNQSQKLQLRWVRSSEMSVSFNVDCAVQGDILLRCRHADNSGSRVSMFRAAFHTGYVQAGVLRLTRVQLDGASSVHFDEDFFIDCIFAPIEKGQVSSTSNDTFSSSDDGGKSGLKEGGQVGDKASGGPGSNVPNTIGVSGAPSDQGLTIDASSVDRYEMSLHKDSRFWEAVATRKTRPKTIKSRKFNSQVTEKFSIVDGEVLEEEEEEVDLLSIVRPRLDSSQAKKEASDRDLIAMLSQVEAEDTNQGNGVADAADGKSGTEGENIPQTKDIMSSVGASTDLTDNQIDRELADLESLEAELALESSGKAKTSDGEGELEDLEELEKYLQSMGT